MGKAEAAHPARSEDLYGLGSEAGDDASTYSGLADWDAIRRSGKYAVVTPDECVALAAAQLERQSSLVFQPLVGGLDPEEGWRSLRLFAEKVAPRLRSGASPSVSAQL